MKLLVCVTFHYSESRLEYLAKICSQYPLLDGAGGGLVEVVVLTNSECPTELERIKKCFPPHAASFSAQLKTVSNLPHPYFLTWAHKAVLKGQFMEDSRYTHFMCVEDDIYVTRENIEYWLGFRAELKEHGLFPSFFRVEGENDLVSVDQVNHVALRKMPLVKTRSGSVFINLPNPYQGMYFFDRELAEEHFAGPSNNPDFGPWDIREKAVQGQTFVNIPFGYTARNVFPLKAHNSITEIDSKCFVRHLPDTYSNKIDSPFGKIRAKELFLNQSFMYKAKREFIGILGAKT